jgi:hypothetical protein
MIGLDEGLDEFMAAPVGGLEETREDSVVFSLELFQVISSYYELY